MNAGLLALLLPLATAQAPVPKSPQPTYLAPAFAARVLAPEGIRVTAYPGTSGARTFDAPATFAFRPGYVYRLELANIPHHPGRTLYPEIEVRGSLLVQHSMKYMDYPAALVFSADDIERVIAGAMITKVVYLEDPEKAIPAEARANSPIEVTADTEAEAVKAAVENGRLVAVVRLGDREPPADELQAVAIPNTILLPGETKLASPPVPPTLTWYSVPLFDPILGPKLATEECTLDGGDRGKRMGIGPDGNLAGLEPSDVGVAFTMGGARKVGSSNTVCICVPRFVVRRVETLPSGIRIAVGPSINQHTTARVEVRTQTPPMTEIGREKPIGTDARIRPMAYLETTPANILVSATRPNITGQIEGLEIKGAVVEAEQLTAYPGVCPLSVTKSVEPAGDVKQGDVLTITLRYNNTGNRPITDISLNDSLSARLGYVPGSALSDRAANFVTMENEAGSVVVRWDFPGKLLPGQGGLVKFMVRVR